MKSEQELWQEYQRVRALRNSGQLKKAMAATLLGAEQALGWALDALRSPSDAGDLKRRVDAKSESNNRRTSSHPS